MTSRVYMNDFRLFSDIISMTYEKCMHITDITLNNHEFHCSYLTVFYKKKTYLDIL